MYSPGLLQEYKIKVVLKELPMTNILKLRITIPDIEPEIWREILIENDTSDELVYLDDFDVSLNNCDSITDDMWFKLTVDGKRKWDNWDPPINEALND